MLGLEGHLIVERLKLLPENVDAALLHDLLRERRVLGAHLGTISGS